MFSGCHENEAVELRSRFACVEAIPQTQFWWSQVDLIIQNEGPRSMCSLGSKPPTTLEPESAWLHPGGSRRSALTCTGSTHHFPNSYYDRQYAYIHHWTMVSGWCLILGGILGKGIKIDTLILLFYGTRVIDAARRVSFEDLGSARHGFFNSGFANHWANHRLWSTDSFLRASIYLSFFLFFLFFSFFSFLFFSFFLSFCLSFFLSFCLSLSLSRP